ncbi:MAG: GNAT family N-acetyltransferase [Prolixibacteraceae bacterium]|nr:GNAT family N-acetyltransferase [Prolixibacteraceae bacterium]
MKSLSDGNIKLRALEPEDLELLYKWENDISVWKVSNNKTPLSKFILAGYIKSSDKDIWESKELRLMIENKEGNGVGTIELFDFDPYNSRAGIGIMIYDNEERRKGIATSAINLISEFAFKEIGIYQLYANISSSNIPSLSLFKVLGFEHTCTKKHWLRSLDKWEDELMFQKVLM